GVPGRRVSQRVWELAGRMVRSLVPEARTGAELSVAGELDPESAKAALKLARGTGLSLTDADVLRTLTVTVESRRAPVGPLPAHVVPEVEAAGAWPAVDVAEKMVVDLDHGLAGTGERVVVNGRHQDKGYIIVKGTDVRAYSRSALRGGRQQLTIPDEGFVVYRTRPPEGRVGKNDVVVRVSIPPGAAILPDATAGIGGAAPGAYTGTANDLTWLLPPNTLARVTVTKIYKRKGNYPFEMYLAKRVNGDLASYTAHAPRKGTSKVTAPAWAWTDAEITEYFLTDGERIPAGYWFHDTSAAYAYEQVLREAGNTRERRDEARAAMEAVRDRTPQRLVMHRVPREKSVTTLVFPMIDGLPVLGGRRVGVAEMGRVLQVLTRQNRDLNRPVFRFLAPGTADGAQSFLQAFVRQTAHAAIGTDSMIWFSGSGAPGLRVGTPFATGSEEAPSGEIRPVVPYDGRWFLAKRGDAGDVVTEELTAGVATEDEHHHLPSIVEEERTRPTTVVSTPGGGHFTGGGGTAKLKLPLPEDLRPALDTARGLLQRLSGIDTWRGGTGVETWRGHGLGHSEVLIPRDAAKRRPAIRLVYDDLTRLRRPVNMITSAANSTLLGNDGLAKDVQDRGGLRMRDWLRERGRQGKVDPGQGTSSPAFNINATYVAHMVGPDFRVPEQQSAKLLYDTYVNLLGQVVEASNPNHPMYQPKDKLYGLETPVRIASLASALLSSGIYHAHTITSFEAALAAFVSTPTDVEEIRIVTKDIAQIEEILDYVAEANRSLTSSSVRPNPDSV
ncbi:MAG: macro domain-containing protein, partial [Gaiellaceae bacterium]